MNKLIKYSDYIYFIGLFFITWGLSAANSVVLLHVIPFSIYGFIGSLIIVGELILTKQYKRLWKFIVLNMKGETTLYVTIVAILASLLSLFVLSPIANLIMLFSLLLVYTVYVLIIKGDKLNIVTLILLLIFIVRYIVYMNGLYEYWYLFRVNSASVALVYVGFLVTCSVLFVNRKKGLELKLPTKILSTMIYISFIMFLMQFNIFNIDCYHSSEIGSYGCYNVTEGFVRSREFSGYFLTVIYLSLIPFSLLYSRIKLEPSYIQQKNEKSAKEMTQFLNKHLEEKNGS